MYVFSLILGIGLLLLVLLDAFQTVILPRRPSGHLRITRLFYLTTWKPWRWMSCGLRDPRTTETLLSFYGPLSLVFLIVVWAGFLTLGFALLYYGMHSPFSDPLNLHPGFRTDFYVSGTTLFTLGLGDVVPHRAWVRELVVLEAGTGLGFVAVVIGYFPVLYSAFSRREVNISLLDPRAGSPPSAGELLRRHAFDGGEAALRILLEEWERWSAELLESHISYPLLCYFRSQHANQSWLSALTAMLDSCALLVATVEEHSGRQAQLTFAMARHALADLAQVFGQEPVAPEKERLPEADFKRLHDLLCQEGVRVSRDAQSQARLAEMRALYEPWAEALSRYLAMPLPAFVPVQPRKTNWLTVARVRSEAEAAAGASARPVAEELDQHLF